MTEQARPFKGIQNRIETLDAPAVDAPVAPERQRVVTEERGRQDDGPTGSGDERTVLDKLLAAGWLNWETVAWLALIMLAVVTRMWELAPRAMHHDESIHSKFSYDMFKGISIYRYDPTWHGPVLYYMVTLSYFVLGGASEFSARFSPALFGIGLVAISWFLRPLLGRIGAFSFGVLMLVSPSVLYYSRSLRHDIYATFGMMLFVIGLFRFAQEKPGRKTWWLALSGIGFFILFGSHEMSFANLGIVLSWLGVIFLFEIMVLPAWVRRKEVRAEGRRQKAEEEESLDDERPGRVSLAKNAPGVLEKSPIRPVRRPVEDDDEDELDDPYVGEEVESRTHRATLRAEQEVESLGQVEGRKSNPPGNPSGRVEGEEEQDLETGAAESVTSYNKNEDGATFHQDEAYQDETEDEDLAIQNHLSPNGEKSPAPKRVKITRPRMGENPKWTDPLPDRTNLAFPVLFGLLGVTALIGALHLFFDKTANGSLQKLFGLDVYIVLIPFYLALAAAVAYPLSLFINYSYTRLGSRSFGLARISAGVIFVLLAAAATLLFLRGKSPAGYVTAVNLKLFGTGSPALNKVADDGFQSFSTFSYGGLSWPSLLPQLVVVAVLAVLGGALVGWLGERRLLVYTERGLYGFGITTFAVMLLASLISLRFIVGVDRTNVPKGALPLIGTVDKWLAYVIVGTVLALIIGVVAGWFVSLAEKISHDELRGSAVLRAILKFARNPWSVAFLLLGFGIPYVLIFSNFFFAPERLADGFYRGIEYWGEQHGKRRLDQPWFYYPMLMLLYETVAVFLFFVALVYFPIAMWRRTARRERFIFTVRGVFIGLTFWWTLLALAFYSVAGEKIPWLNVQIAVPASLASAAFLNDYLRRMNWKRLFSPKEGLLFAGLFSLAFAATLVLIGMAVNFPRREVYNAGLGRPATNNDITIATVQMLLVGLIGLSLFAATLWMWWSSRLSGRTARAIVMLLFTGLLFIYCVKSTIALNYGHPDTAVEPMIYTQTTPEVPLFVERLGRLSRDIRDNYKVVPQATDPNQLPPTYLDPANSKGIPLYVSSETAWPLSWYLREYTNVCWCVITPNDSAPVVLDRLTDNRGNNYVAIMVSSGENTAKLQQQLQGQYTAHQYRFRWHFPEDESGYGGLGYMPAEETREYRIAAKDIVNTRWDMFYRSFTEQPFAGRLWRYLAYRELWQPLQSFDMVVYIRNDVNPDFGLTSNTSTNAGTGAATNPDNGVAFDLTSSTQAGNRNGQYRTPRNITVAPNGDVLVLDSLNGRVQRFDKDGKFVSKFGAIGNLDGQFTLSQYESGPGGIAADEEGNVYVTDTWGYRVQKFDKDGKFIAKWGQGGQDTQGDPAKNEQFATYFYGPRSIAYDQSAGELYITDTGNKRVVVYDKNGTFKRQFGTKGKGPAQFDEPISIGISPDGKVYVTDLRNRRVQILDKQGAYLSEIAVTSWKDAILGEPYLTFGPEGDLYVSDPVNGTVLRFDKQGQLVNTYGSTTGLALLNPVGMAFDKEGNLYIADAKRNAIVKTKP